jgi:1-deoxy-D-xylulose-5-phosphate synthase
VRSSQLGAETVWLEAKMTKNRDFKRLVRARAAKTGQSYQLSRRIVTGPGSIRDGSLLAHINSPSDLRHLSYAQLDALAAEIRGVIVKTVLAIGQGHLGSNLGAVELTLALHRVFHSPSDILLWDTGHQTYTHKLVTGRREAFAGLRQEGGLSGYPCRAESAHDWVENSHASTILSYAHGLASALNLKGDETGRKVVAVVGDGALTGGMAYEGLNNLGHSARPVIIVANDNGRSYAPTVSKLSESLTRLRLSPRYQHARFGLGRAVHELPGVGRLAATGWSALRAAAQGLVGHEAFFDALGVRYVGPVDGHDIEAMERAFRGACAYTEGPIVVHVLTEKGKGYPPAEQDAVQHLHDFKLGSIDSSSGAPSATYGDAFTKAVVTAAERDPRVVAVTAAMPGPTGLIPFEARFPDRFFDVGIAEQHAATAAAGMAMGGLRPVVAIYSTFFGRAFDQAVYDVGLHGLPVVFVFDRAGITGDDGPSHHGVLDLALTLTIPGMTIFAPSSAQEVPVMLEEALRLAGPAALRWPKGPARQVAPGDVGSGLNARRVRAGSEVCLLAVGRMVQAAEDAADALARHGITATVWDVRVAKPLDPELLADAGRHRLVVSIEDGIRVGGVGSHIVDALTTQAFSLAGSGGVRAGWPPHQATPTGRPPRVIVLGVPSEYIPHGNAAAILARLGLDGAGIANTVLAAVGSAGPEPKHPGLGGDQHDRAPNPKTQTVPE